MLNATGGNRATSFSVSRLSSTFLVVCCVRSSVCVEPFKLLLLLSNGPLVGCKILCSTGAAIYTEKYIRAQGAYQVQQLHTTHIADLRNSWWAITGDRFVLGWFHIWSSDCLGFSCLLKVGV